VWPESYELGTHIFTLRQNLKGDGVSCNLAFDGASNKALVIWMCAEKILFRKLDGRAAVVGIATVGNVY
jgi:hypothetical protein